MAAPVFRFLKHSTSMTKTKASRNPSIYAGQNKKRKKAKQTSKESTPKHKKKKKRNKAKRETIQEALRLFVQDAKKEQVKKEHLVSASPFFRYPLYFYKEDHEDSPDRENQLVKNDACFEDKIIEAINEFAGDKRVCFWISKTLPCDFNLPINTKTPAFVKCTQAFVICEGRPPFLMSVSENADNMATVTLFAKKVSSSLHGCLLNFCHLDFTILTCILTCDQLTGGPHLEREVLKQEEIVKAYFKKPSLDITKCQQLKEAATALAGATFAPCLLEETDKNKMWVFLLSRPWRDTLSEYIEVLHKGKLEVRLSAESPLRHIQYIIAALESTKRTSLYRPIKVTSLLKEVHRCLHQIKEHAQTSLGIDLQLQTSYLALEDNTDREYILLSVEVDKQECVKHALRKDDLTEVANILSECSRTELRSIIVQLKVENEWDWKKEYTDVILTELISAHNWESVKNLVQLGKEERKSKWTVGETPVNGEMLIMIADKRWQKVSELLSRDVEESQRRWATLTASSLIANSTEFIRHILPQCSDDQLDSVLTILVKRCLWKAAWKALKQTDESMKQLVVKKALEPSDELYYATTTSTPSHCTDDYLDSLLKALVKRRLWEAAGELLKQNVSDTVKQWALKETCEQCWKFDYQTIQNILRHCADDQLDSVLTTLVERRLWQAVGEVLKRGVSDSVKRWAVMETCKYYDNFDFFDDEETLIMGAILFHCADDQLESMLTMLVKRRLWGAVGEVLKRGVSDSVQRWVVEETCKHYNAFECHHSDEEFITEAILSHCADDQLDSVLTTLVERRLWRAVGVVLKRNVSDSVKQWAVTKACQLCDEADCNVLHDILPHCADDKVQSVLIILMQRRLWWAVGEFGGRGVGESVTQWAVMEACEHLEHSNAGSNAEDALIVNILPHCADDQLDSVLTILVEQRLWRAVAEMFKRSVSDSVKLWAVWEACQHCGEANSTVIHDLLSHCAYDQLDSVLTTLVERRLWRAVVEVLERDVSDSLKQWAVMEACKHCDEADNDVLIDILPHCADDQLDSVLTALVERCLWQAVALTLVQGGSDSVKQWAVLEVCRYLEQLYPGLDAEEVPIEDILSHCTEDQLDSVLTILVEQRMWKGVGELLKRSDSEFKKNLEKQQTCEHCRSAEVYISKYHVADDSQTDREILLPCTDASVKAPEPVQTSRYVCKAVRNVPGREVSDLRRRENIKIVFQCADEKSMRDFILPYYVYETLHSALKLLASRGFWSAFVVLLHYSIIDTLYMWAVVKDTESKDKVFLDMVRNPCDGIKELTPAMWRSVTWSRLQRSLKQLLDWNTPLCEVLCESLLATVKEIWLSGLEREIDVIEDTVLEEALSTVEHLHQLISPVLAECKTFHVSGVRYRYAERRSSKCFLFQLYVTKNLVHQYYKHKAWEQMTDAILVVLTTVPVVPDVQSVALRVMLRHNRWDVIRHACLSGVCEQDRRQLFQAAVKQRQWSAVKRWADHTLYDDQRGWALREARQDKRWDVYLKLADHGLSEWERVGVLFRVTMHADWKLVRYMLKTVADVTDMIDLLTNTPGASSKLGATNYEQRMNEVKQFEKDVTKHTNTLRSLKTMAKRGKWWVVLHNIRHKPNLQHARRALKAAVSSEAWHAVMQLVKLETDVTRRDSLFRDMVRLRQWAVCRELLEQGVSQQLCLDKLSELKEQHQWTLVAMVMECPMDDDSRKEVMYQAMQMREGSVVWECINKLQTRLSVEERKNMFQLAFNREVWQAVKPLIEEKDLTGIRHRDTALLEAIEQHQWDVVDHCQRHHADINMKDDDGHTPIHRAARKGDWEAVEELTVRGGDPNLYDDEGLSVLHRAIRAKQWDAVSLLIQYHGHIHQAAQYTDQPDRSDTRTPLRMLIDARQGELIKLTLMWCPDQWKGVNGKGETALHAAFLSGYPYLAYGLIARKVDPLAVTVLGHTALCYAVLCKDCPQRMVAEGIELGFSTHQPHITETAPSDQRFVVGEEPLLISPFALAILRGLPVVTQMLYESGACSYKELFTLNTQLSHTPYNALPGGRHFQAQFIRIWNDVHNCGDSDPDYSFDAELMQKSTEYLRQVSSTPRSLVSTCRLVIHHCLTLSKTRHRDVDQLPLKSMMKNYVMFSDLTDPRYPDLSY